MRLFTPWMKRFFSRISGATLLLGPPLIILFWGGFYFYVSVRQLLDLKTPIQLSYQAPGGTYCLQANQLSLDVLTKQFKLKDVLLKDPHQQRIFSSQETVIKWSGEKTDVFLKGVYVFIERSALGLSLNEAIPISEKHAKPVPFSIRADQIYARYVDQFGSPSLYETAKVKAFQLDAFGENWIAKAEVEVPKMGKFPFCIENNVARGLWVKMKLDQANAVDVLPHLKRWLPEKNVFYLEDISFASSSLTGPIWLYFPVDATPKIYAELKGTVENVKYKEILEKASLSIESSFLDYYVRAKVDSVEGAQKIHFNGAISWEKELNALGECKAFVSTENKIPAYLRKALPQGIHFKDASLQSWIGWSTACPELIGTVVSKEATWNKQVAKNLKTKVFLESQKLSAELVEGSWGGAKATGALEVDFQKRKVDGFLDSNQIDLRKLGGAFQMGALSGEADLKALLKGTTDEPYLILNATGNASWGVGAGQKIGLGSFSGRAELSKDDLKIERLIFSDKFTRSFVFGSYDFNKNQLNVDLQADHISLNQLYPEFKGEAQIIAKMGGSLSAPELKGEVSCYQFIYKDLQIPYIQSNILANLSEVQIQKVQTLLPIGQLEGSGYYSFNTGFASGELRGSALQSSEWTKNHVAGIFALDDFWFKKDAKGFSGEASLSSKELFSFGIPATDVRAKVAFNQDNVNLSSLTAKVDQGAIEGSLKYLLKDQKGSGTFNLKDFPLQLLPLESDSFALKGLCQSGSGSIEIGPNGLETLASGYGFKDVVVNKNLIGGGSLSLSYKDNKWDGFGILGNIERTLQVNPFSYDQNTGLFQVKGFLDNISIEDLFGVSKRYLNFLPKESLSMLSGLKGNLEGNYSSEGNLKNLKKLKMEFPDVKGTALSLFNHPLGEIQLSANYDYGNLNLENLFWNFKDASFHLNGTFSPKEGAHFDGDLKNLDLMWITAAYPVLPKAVGKIDSAFKVEGSIDHPRVEGDLKISEIGFWNEQQGVQRFPVALTFDQILYQGHLFKLSGSYRYENINGPMTAQIPLNLFSSKLGTASKKIESEEFYIHSEMPERDLNTFSEALGWLDPARSSGKVGGWLDLKAGRGEYQIDGQFKLDNGTLALRDFQTELHNFNAKLNAHGSEIEFLASADGSAGGKISMDLSGGLQSWLESGLPVEEKFRRSAVQGKIGLEHLTLSESELFSGSKMSGMINGGLIVSGNMLEPEIGGACGFQDLDILYRSTPTEEGQHAIGPFFINPYFNQIELTTLTPAKIKTSTSFLGMNAIDVDLELKGNGVLKGSLQNPDLSMNFRAQKGHLRLPTSRVAIEEGSSFRYNLTSAPGHFLNSSLDLNVEGSTQLMAYAGKRLTNRISRYDIRLHATGNILGHEQLVLHATSDPPDLTSQEILAMLIQSESFLKLSEAAFQGQRSGSVFSSALMGFAFPYFTSPITEQMANFLSLDYVGIEYDPLQQLVFTAGKTIGKGFTLRGLQTLNLNRDLGASMMDTIQREIGITYRLPLKNRFFQRAMIDFGYEQPFGWRLSLEYGRRL